jgi:dienelactone hydrolase
VLLGAIYAAHAPPAGPTDNHDPEAWASAAVDWLETREDVDDGRIGIVGWSLGGYYAPRAAAFEERFALCVV